MRQEPQMCAEGGVVAWEGSLICMLLQDHGLHHMAMDNHIPSSGFASTQAQAEERFAAWREVISVVFDVAPLTRESLQGFEASVRASHLGQLLLVEHCFGAQQFSRLPARIARDGLDHYLVQWYRQGGFVGQCDDDQNIEVKSGDIAVFALDRAQRTLAQASQGVSLIVPRTLVEDSFGKNRRELHGTVLSAANPLGGLLADHIASLQKHLPSVTLADTPAVAQATAQMLAACLQPSQHAWNQAQGALQAVTRERIQQYIARHVREQRGESLTPQALACAFGISRSQLYRLFEPLGGVAGYVQQRRLLRAFHDLANPLNRRLRVAEIAARLGFVSEAHFSRAFRAAFGLTPSDVRAMRQPICAGGGAVAQATTGIVAEYTNWIQGL